MGETAILPSNLADHEWLGDEDGHNCETCVERDDTLHMCWPQAHLCPVCEKAPNAWPDVLCEPCRTAFVRGADTLTDPVEQALGAHLRVVVSDDDHQLCVCGWNVEGGPALHRRHQAAAVYAALGMEGPSPWIIGPDSDMREAMESAGHPPKNGSSAT